jgi:hypothetical protein
MKEMGSSFEYGGGLLSLDRVDRLDRLGFVWDVHQVRTIGTTEVSSMNGLWRSSFSRVFLYSLNASGSGTTRTMSCCNTRRCTATRTSQCRMVDSDCGFSIRGQITIPIERENNQE